MSVVKEECNDKDLWLDAEYFDLGKSEFEHRVGCYLHELIRLRSELAAVRKGMWDWHIDTFIVGLIAGLVAGVILGAL